jgi:lipopolysaccharide transport system permease protein
MPSTIVAKLTSQRELIEGLTKREIFGRYRGSYFGPLWSLINPLIMLLVYLFVFGVVFKARFGYTPTESATDYGLTLFCSLNLFNMFAEIVTRSAGLIVERLNFVKKVVFPLEVIPVSLTGSALFHCLMAFLPMIGFLVYFHRMLPVSALIYSALPLAAYHTCSRARHRRSFRARRRDPVEFGRYHSLMCVSAVFYLLKAVPEQLRVLIQSNGGFSGFGQASGRVASGTRLGLVCDFCVLDRIMCFSLEANGPSPISYRSLRSDFLGTR